jgi:hypothetical protein
MAAYNRAMERDGLEALLRSAFAGVQLGDGLSLRQLDAVDSFMQGVDLADFERLPQFEVADDWTQVPEDEIHTACVAHMDAESLRYYLPALLTWLLDHYERGDMTTIGTLSALTPDEYRRPMYESFTPAQRAAVAAVVEALPFLDYLDPLDELALERAFADDWRAELPSAL